METAGDFVAVFIKLPAGMKSRHHDFGGGDIFQLALPSTDTIIVTALDRDVEGDVYFEQIDLNQFKLVEQKT